MPSIQNTTILSLPWDHPDSIQLRTTQRAEVNVTGDPEAGIPPSAADIPVFLVAYHANIPVGCGGLRQLPPSYRTPDNAAEIKRMFVDPLYRGPIEGSNDLRTSIASLILTRLEEEAVGRGWGLLLLETGGLMGKARRFYERCGYVERKVFGNYSEADNSVYYEKRLYSSVVAAVLLNGHATKGHDDYTSRPAWDVSEQS